MSKKRAIEAAMERIRASADTSETIDFDCDLIVPSMLNIHDELEAIHLEGRIAGLREAARIALAEWDAEVPAEIIRGHARKLAKKARAK